MITIFNRKELFITNSMEDQARIRDLLSAHNIDYTISTFGNLWRSEARGYPGMNNMAQTEYFIYVNRSDYDQAVAILDGKKLSCVFP
ncbi:hypothetical protein [Anaerotignum sp.]|uniref:hypothetical protein n=1 Tax=Anaerotignum sp. TaxID=2039241 RepID=UPI003316AC49